jgi:hypothetical protein
MPRTRLPDFDDEEQMCAACTYVAKMYMSHHEPGCDGHEQCGNTPWILLQQPHMHKKCPRCSYTWAENSE